MIFDMSDIKRDLKLEYYGKVADKPKIESKEEIKAFKVFENLLQVGWNGITVENSCLGTGRENYKEWLDMNKIESEKKSQWEKNAWTSFCTEDKL